MKSSDNSYDPLIAEAVRSQPLADPPPAMLSAIMAEVQRDARKPRFILSWYEVALGIFFVLMAGASVGTAWFLARGISPQEMKYMMNKLSSPDPAIFFPIIIVGLVIAVGIGLIALVIAILETFRTQEYQVR